MKKLLRAPFKHAGRAMKGIKGNLYAFIFYFLIAFFLVFTLFGVIGLLPRDIQEQVQPKPLIISGTEVESEDLSKKEEPALQYTKGVLKETPLRIVIPRVGVNAAISNPQSSSNLVLDQALKDGAVRYPESGLLGEDKNVFLFGHSSYSKTLGLSYKTFNGLERMVEGDEIRVDGAELSHIYRVIRVSFLKDSEAYIDLSQTVRMLTLSTCDTIGKREDRVVVQAVFVKTVPLGQN